MIINVINNKGGTGKTTTSVNLAAALATLGKEVLLVDLDSQSSASLSLGVQAGSEGPGFMDALLGDVPMRALVTGTHVAHLSIAGGGMDLANSDLALATVQGRERRLRACLDGIEEYFDYILLDSPPSMSMIFVNAIMAADYFLVPLTPEYLAYEGFRNLMKAIGAVKMNMGAGIELLGVLFTMVNPLLKVNRKVTREIMSEMERAYGEYVFKTRIVRSAMLCEAPASGQSIFGYAPRSVGARNYEHLAREVVDRCAMMSCGAQGA